MKDYQIELSAEDKKVFLILDTIPNPYNIFKELNEAYPLDIAQDEAIHIQQHNWQTPLELVLKKGD
jgi:hypothetical protein